MPPGMLTRLLTAARMTGLEPSDRIIEIAVIVTDGQLNPLDEGVAYSIRTPKPVLDAMAEWCVTTHGNSGLTAACLNPSISRDHADVRAAILAYVIDRVPDKRVACLAGNTVHADAVFLKREAPELIEHLHYRIVDVSSIKEIAKRWYGGDTVWSKGKASHHALDDIRDSIAELKYYRQKIFVKNV